MGNPNADLAEFAGGRDLLDGARDRIVWRTTQAFTDEKCLSRSRSRAESGASGACANGGGPYAIGVETGAGAEKWLLFCDHQQRLRGHECDPAIPDGGSESGSQSRRSQTDAG